MKKIIMSLLIALFIFPVTIFADDCTNEEIVKLKTAASKIQAKLVVAYYPKIMHSDDADEDYIVEIPYVKVSLSNLTADFDYKLVKNNIVLWDSRRVAPENGSYTYSVLDDYDSVRTISLFLKSKKCYMQELNDISLTIPMLNPYYNLGLCQGAKDFYLCQELWYQDYTGYKVVDEVAKYKNKEIDENGKKKEKSFLEKLNAFVKKNYIILISALALILGAGVVIFVRRRIRVKKHFG